MSDTIHNPPTPAFKPEGYVTKKELAGLLKRGLRTIDTWMADGQIPYYKKGRNVIFKWSEIDATLRACRVYRPHEKN